MKKIILASSSPRRQFLLKQIGIDFKTASSDVEESFEITESAENTAIDNAYIKAKDIASRKESENSIIIAGDTVVVIDNKILGKPKTKEQARKMIESMSGKTHQVITGLAMIDTEKGKCIKDFEKTDVTFRKLTKHDVDVYIKTGDYMDAAGAYKIQKHAAALIERIEGCYSAVVGFPVTKAIEMLRKLDVKI